MFCKKGKSPDLPGSYRPISLLNCDSKIYSKILSNRLSKIINPLASVNQHGFILGLGTVTHVNKVVTLFDIAQVEKRKLGLIILDAEKAFDRVEWAYLWELMQRMGFGKGFLTAIQVLYSTPVSKIAAMGMQSEPVTITRGAQQGCPCSPLLFALYINPLIEMFGNNHLIKPFIVQDIPHSIFAYADDIAITTIDPMTALKEIEWLSIEFGQLSGYKLNVTNTQILCTDKIVINDVRSVTKVTYLGIKIRTSMSDLVAVNWTATLNNINESLDRWGGYILH